MDFLTILLYSVPCFYTLPIHKIIWSVIIKDADQPAQIIHFRSGCINYSLQISLHKLFIANQPAQICLCPKSFCLLSLIVFLLLPAHKFWYLLHHWATKAQMNLGIQSGQSPRCLLAQIMKAGEGLASSPTR